LLLAEDRVCDCGCEETFTPNRWHQRFKDRKHRMRFHNRRLFRRKLKGGAGAQNDACKTLLATPRMRRFSVALCWQKRGKYGFTPGGRPVLRVYPDGVVASFRLLPKRRDSGFETRDMGKAKGEKANSEF
jgi:hypothetical protein